MKRIELFLDQFSSWRLISLVRQQSSQSTETLTETLSYRSLILLMDLNLLQVIRKVSGDVWRALMNILCFMLFGFEIKIKMNLS